MVCLEKGGITGKDYKNTIMRVTWTIMKFKKTAYDADLDQTIVDSEYKEYLKYSFDNNDRIKKDNALAKTYCGRPHEEPCKFGSWNLVCEGGNLKNLCIIARRTLRANEWKSGLHIEDRGNLFRIPLLKYTWVYFVMIVLNKSNIISNSGWRVAKVK